MTLPNGNINTSKLESATSKPTEARSDLHEYGLQMNQLIASLNQANGLAQLNQSGKVQASQLQIGVDSLPDDGSVRFTDSDFAINSITEEKIRDSNILSSMFDTNSFLANNPTLGTSDVKVASGKSVREYADNNLGTATQGFPKLTLTYPNETISHTDSRFAWGGGIIPSSRGNNAFAENQTTFTTTDSNALDYDTASSSNLLYGRINSSFTPLTFSGTSTFINYIIIKQEGVYNFELGMDLSTTNVLSTSDYWEWFIYAESINEDNEKNHTMPISDNDQNYPVSIKANSLYSKYDGGAGAKCGYAMALKANTIMLPVLIKPFDTSSNPTIEYSNWIFSITKIA